MRLLDRLLATQGKTEPADLPVPARQTGQWLGGWLSPRLALRLVRLHGGEIAYGATPKGEPLVLTHTDASLEYATGEGVIVRFRAALGQDGAMGQIALRASTPRWDTYAALYQIEWQGEVHLSSLLVQPLGRSLGAEWPQMTLDLTTQWRSHHRDGAPDLYPEHLREEMDEVMDLVFRDVNNGVYRCGFATSQAAYDAAVARVFATLDYLDQRLATRRYLMGDAITEADVRLWVTLARFDPVYVTHFKANLRRLVDYPNLWPYARDLYQVPAFGETTSFDHIKRHYFGTHPHLNPSPSNTLRITT